MHPVDLERAFAAITTFWDPHVAGELNGQLVKCVKLRGEFIWHQHETEDELFLVHRGTLELRLRDQVVTLRAGQFFIVPRGVEHQPFAPDVAEVVLFEPASTLNTGDVRHALTKENLKRIPPQG
jgi:mannose-6-phosphate isomerase-like protein (cupin superfamily)